MERTLKTWGRKTNLRRDTNSETSFLEIKPWQRCSWHKHQTKFNLFFVIRGILYIKTIDGVAEVLPGGVHTTSPLEFHEFQTREEGAEIVEIMYVEYDPEDIDRRNIGGPLKHDEE